MNFRNVIKVFKLGSKASAKHKGKKVESDFTWPSGLRIGIFGHANSGKTVYFTVLNEESKIAKDLQISVTDNATAGEFLSNYRALWGLGTATGAGTVVDFRGEKKFPEPTSGDKLLIFNAIIDRTKKVSVVTYDYNGRAVSITDNIDLKNKVIDFMTGCQGLLFFYDSKYLAAEIESQERAASFVSMLELLAPLRSRLPIPIALVVTKADILPGFAGEDQTILINPEDEDFLAEEFEPFLDNILSSNKIAANSIWAGTIRNILVRLKDFLRIVTGRTLNFQIFFISNTGQTPEKIGTDIGRSIYAPPAKISPVGVKAPFYWILKSILRNRKISRMRKVARFVVTVSLIWIVLYSLPFLYHLKFLLPRTAGTESAILESYKGNIYNISEGERKKIIDAYQSYERSFVVRYFYSDFQNPAGRVRNSYTTLDMAAAAERLNQIIKGITRIVSDTTLWPKPNPIDSSLIKSEMYTELVGKLNSFHQGDESSILYTRSDRTLAYLALFESAVRNPSDTASWSKIGQQVQTDLNVHGKELSSDEVALQKALSERKVKKVQIVTAQKTASELGGVISQINGNDNPSFRLDTAVTILKENLANLDPAVDKKSIDMINRYIQSVGRFSRKQKFLCKIENLPEKSHIHIEVTEKGKDPLWVEHNQIFAADTLSLTWKSGDEIHIAIDLHKHKCKWGKEPSDKKILKGKFSIFDMDGEIMFDNAGKKASISFVPPLKEQLPVLQ
jgi:GTPase SAR1 family protein